MTTTPATSPTATDSSLSTVKESFRKYELVPYCIIIVIGFLANVTVIWNGIMKRARFRAYSNCLFLSLAFADLGVVLMAIPINIVEYTRGLDISQFTCAYIIPIRETFQCAAMLSVAILGVFRVRQITRRYNMPIPRRSLLGIVIIIWLSSYLLISLPFAFVFKINPDGECNSKWPNPVMKKIHLTFTSTVLGLPMVVVTICYVTILKKIKNLVWSNNECERTARKSRNLSMLLIMLIITCWISYVPLAVYTLVSIYDDVHLSATMFSIVSVLFYSSSAIDPVLVLMMSRDYRFRLPRRLARKCRVGHVRDQNEIALQNQKKGPTFEQVAGKNKEEK